MRCDPIESEWGAIEPLVPTRRHGVKPKKNRKVIVGIVCVLRPGAPWRDLRCAPAPIREAGWSVAPSNLLRRKWAASQAVPKTGRQKLRPKLFAANVVARRLMTRGAE
jgi:transposase